jgi:hypothetical protein
MGDVRTLWSVDTHVYLCVTLGVFESMVAYCLTINRNIV